MESKKMCRTYGQDQPAPTTRLLYDRKSAAQLLSISIRSLDYLVANRKIPTRRIGSRVLIHNNDLTRFAQGVNLRSVA
jgi:excisionase family DNA binding protein